MKYQEVSIQIIPFSEERSEIIIALLSDQAYESFVNQDDGLKAFIPEEQFDEDALIQVLADVVAAEEAVDLQIDYEVQPIPEENWNALWESNFEPVQIGTRLLIRAPFHPIQEGIEREIVMEPKMSFGTGHHATTYLMSEAILDFSPVSARVLDMGCGTGVLAILALMTGAKEACAVDIDHWCYESTIENAQRNGVLEQMQVLLGDASVLTDLPVFDVIYANINRNILLADMAIYVQHLQKGGYIYFSGIYTEDFPMIDSCAQNLGLVHLETREKSNWICLRYRLQ